MELPGINDLEDFLDKNIICYLQNEKWFLGILRSFDKYGNLTLEDAEEVSINSEFVDRQVVNTVIIRGENINYFGLLSENYERVYENKLIV